MKRFAVMCLLCLVVVLTACQTAQTDMSKTEGAALTYETIERSEGFRVPHYEDKEPLLVVLTQTSDIDQIEEFISDQLKNNLEHINYTENIVAAVFQGWKSSGSYEVNILEVVQDEQRVLIYANFLEPLPDREAVDAETSPYEFIKIRRGGLGGTLLFELIVDGTSIQQAEITIDVD